MDCTGSMTEEDVDELKQICRDFSEENIKLEERVEKLKEEKHRFAKAIKLFGDDSEELEKENAQLRAALEEAQSLKTNPGNME